jgi:hypothetical protein
MDYAELRRKWQQQVEAEELEAAGRAGWVPVRPQEDAPVILVFGGTAAGWEALLTILGAGLLGEGRRLTLLNLSQRRVAATLEDFLARSGHSTRRDLIRSVGAAYDAQGAGDPELLNWIMRVLHPHGGKSERLDAMTDRSILETVAGALGDSVSMPRLRAGLRAVLGQPSGDGSALSPEEFDRLVVLYPEDVRSRTDVIQRAFQLEQHLARLAAEVPEADRQPESLDLRVVDVDPELGHEDFDEITEGLVERLVVRWRRAEDLSSEAVLIAGASERFDPRLFETFANMAVRKHGRVVLLFERLRAEAIEALGVQGSCHSFMRLTDNRDAEAACDFIGREDKFVIAQTTRQRGSAYERGENVSLGTQWGTSQSQSLQGGLFSIGSNTTTTQSGGARTVGDTSGESQNVSISVTEELRTDELIVRPTEIQGLPETALFVVEQLQPRVVKLVDCDPNLVLLGAP